MTYSAPLPNTGVILPIPGSGQAWEVAVHNGNFTGVENAITADRARIATVEGKIANNGVIPAGSTAARDGFYGVPASAAARIALANSAPRWFNTDKGYQERYFTSTADSATGGYNTLYARKTARWAPEGIGLIPINWPTPILSPGGATLVTVAGNTLTIASGTTATAVAFDGVLTDDFTQYQLDFNVYGQGVAGFAAIEFRSAGVPQVAAGSYTRQAMSAVGAAVSSSSITDVRAFLTASVAGGYSGTARIIDPAEASRVTVVGAQSWRGDANGFISTSHVAALDDGLRIFSTGGGTIAGEFKLYGLGGGHQ